MSASCPGNGSGLGCEHGTPCPDHPSPLDALGFDGCAEQAAITDEEAFAAASDLAQIATTALAAVTLALDVACADPDARRVIRPGSEIWARLCAAEAAMLGRAVEEVSSERAARVPQGPRRYMSPEEWTAYKAGEIAGEGVLGSHWPGKRCGAVWPGSLAGLPDLTCQRPKGHTGEHCPIEECKEHLVSDLHWRPTTLEAEDKETLTRAWVSEVRGHGWRWTVRRGSRLFEGTARGKTEAITAAVEAMQPKT